jgi:hypothetical protein
MLLNGFNFIDTCDNMMMVIISLNSSSKNIANVTNYLNIANTKVVLSLFIYFHLTLEILLVGSLK